MRTTLNLEEDALVAAKHLAARRGISLGSAVSALLRAGAQAAPADVPVARLRGRFALLPRRDEAITPDQVRELMARENI